MPVILPPEAWRRWLGEDETDIQAVLDLLRPYPAKLMRAYPVGQRVGTVRNDDPAMLGVGIKRSATRPVFLLSGIATLLDVFSARLPGGKGGGVDARAGS